MEGGQRLCAFWLRPAVFVSPVRRGTRKRSLAHRAYLLKPNPFTASASAIRGCIETLRQKSSHAIPPGQRFLSGKAAALNFLKDQVMKLSKGKANPNLVGEILERKLKRRHCELRFHRALKLPSPWARRRVCGNRA